MRPLRYRVKRDSQTDKRLRNACRLQFHSALEALVGQLSTAVTNLQKAALDEVRLDAELHGLRVACLADRRSERVDRRLVGDLAVTVGALRARGEEDQDLLHVQRKPVQR